ncbi:phage Gp19/Gp15/Gp42 family protein [Holdemanella biformis]
MDYATIDDIKVLWRSMSEEESARAIALIPIVCGSLRNEAKKTGKNLDQMVSEDPDLLIVAKSVTVDVVARTLMTSTDKEPMSQFSESALGYSASGTFLVPGGGLFIKRSELDRLGIKNKQKIRTIDMCGGTND